MTAFTKTKRWIISLLLVGSNMAAVSAFAQTTAPSVINYQGRLLDNVGAPLTGAYDFRFSLWTDGDFTSGTDVDGAGAINTGASGYANFQEVQNLTVGNFGLFTAQVGSVGTLPNLDVNTHAYLQVEVKANGQPDTAYEVLDPDGVDNTNDRKELTSSAFALNAEAIDNKSLDVNGRWEVAVIPEGTNQDTFTIDSDDSAANIDLQFGTGATRLLRYDSGNSWFSFGSDINLGQNEVKSFAVDNLGAAPGTPVAGQMYYDTTTGDAFIWDAVGAAWRDITQGAGSAGDLDDVYDNDANQTLAVDNANGLSFDSSVAGDIIFDLQSTGDLVVQDNGTTFAAFTDTGEFLLEGNAPSGSIFQVDSNAADTVAIGTFENNVGSSNWFITTTTPESAITASIGDLVIDSTNGNAYIKNTGSATNTGFLQFAGQIPKTVSLNAQYSDTIYQGDGGNNQGTLEIINASGVNFYDWTTTKLTPLQDVDIVVSFTLPDDFQAWDTNPIQLLVETDTNTLSDNVVDVSLDDTTNSAATLTSASNLVSSGGFTTKNIGISTGTYTAGGNITLTIKLSAIQGHFARVADLKFNYIGIQ